MLKKLRLSEWIAGLSALVLFAGSGAVIAQNKLEPAAPPGPTMKTLDEIPPTWSQILPANDTGDPCNSSRFKCVLPTTAKPTGAAVLDKETGLVWQKTVEIFRFNWNGAHNLCASQLVGGRGGWRLPSIQELSSLVDPAGLPAGHPFENVDLSSLESYWSATAFLSDTTIAFTVNFGFAEVSNLQKANSARMWCVRGGRGADAQ